jgi:hypothetical protein
MMLDFEDLRRTLNLRRDSSLVKDTAHVGDFLKLKTQSRVTDYHK